MNKKNILSNLSWRFLERFGAQGVTLIVSIILARLLEPEVYGMVALVTVITSILQVFVDSGLGVALIQKKDADDTDFSSVFYFNFLVCIVLYIGLFLAAPAISNYYSMSDLTSVIRVLGLVLIISGFKNIQTAYVSKHLLFKKYFIATLGGTILAAFIGIWMAYSGYGVWALVFQNIANQTVDTIILWFIVKWRPKALFSAKRLRKLFSFGWKLLASSLLDTIWNQLRQLIIGKRYSAGDLAYYNKGHEFPLYATTAINNSIDSVLFPIMSNSQGDKEKVKNIARRAIKTSSFILWPMMIGLAACSKSFVTVVLTEKWLFCVPYMQIFCIVYAFQPIHTSNLNAIKALGRSDLFLLLEVLKKIVNLVIILITMQFGVFWLAAGSIVGSIACQIINSWPNKKLLNYSYIDQITDILPSLLLAVFMGMCVYTVSYCPLPAFIILCVQIIVGIVVYTFGAYFTKNESFFYCLDLASELIQKRNRK